MRATVMRFGVSSGTIQCQNALLHVQASVRASRGEEITVFERISDGSHSFLKGEAVRVQGKSKKAQIVGRILHFYVQKASPECPSPYL